MPGAGGDMGGGAAGGAAGGMGPTAGGDMRVMKKGKQEKPDQDQMPAPMVKLTSIEQKMANILVDLVPLYNIHPNRIRALFPVQNPEGGKPYQIDFAIPHLKLGCEADGLIWHSNPNQAEDDKHRDYLLAQRGWTILRFDDKSIEEATQAVRNTIGKYLSLAVSKTKTASSETTEKTASTDIEEISKIALFTIKQGSIVEIGEYDKYIEIIKGHYVYSIDSEK